MPIIDLTPSAEGSSLAVDLQRAVSFGAVTSIDITNTTRGGIVDTPGFHKISITATGLADSDTTLTSNVEIYDGTTYKVLYDFKVARAASGSGYRPIQPVFDFIVYLNAGEAVVATETSTDNRLTGHTYQIADVNGNTINPSGFVAQ